MLDATLSRAAKQQRMQLALDYSGDQWRERVLEELAAWIAAQRAQGRSEMTMEQFRAVAKNHPHSPAAWGPMAVVACKAGLIVPMTHPDGSPVYRLAQSVKTHRHPVRAYAFASSFSAAPTGTECPSTHDREPAEAVYQPQAGERVGDGRVSSIADARREVEIQHAAREVEQHMAAYAATGDFSERGAADRARLHMEQLIRERSPEQVERLERKRGLS